jgi:hypothetical protein
MSLTKQDLQDIAAIVNSIVNSAVEASEKRMTAQIDGKIDSAIETSEQRMDDKFNKMFIHFTNEDKKRDEQFEQITAMFSKLHDSIDGIAGDYKVLRDEETIGAHLARQANEKIEDHEQRIGKLEQAQA